MLEWKGEGAIGFGLACLTNQKTCGVSFIYTQL